MYDISAEAQKMEKKLQLKKLRDSEKKISALGIWKTYVIFPSTT